MYVTLMPRASALRPAFEHRGAQQRASMKRGLYILFIQSCLYQLPISGNYVYTLLGPWGLNSIVDPDVTWHGSHCPVPQMHIT